MIKHMDTKIKLFLEIFVVLQTISKNLMKTHPTTPDLRSPQNVKVLQRCAAKRYMS